MQPQFKRAPSERILRPLRVSDLLARQVVKLHSSTTSIIFKNVQNKEQKEIFVSVALQNPLCM